MDLASSDGNASKHVLLVEDNPGDIRLMKEAMAQGPVPTRLTILENGEDAIAFLHRHPPFEAAERPDILLLDLNLPRRDGREVLEDIKQDPRLRSIPVIVLTTSESEADVKRAYQLNANCYIQKPADLDEFMRTVAACEKFWFQIVRLPSK